MVQYMVTPANHVIAGPNLPRAGPLARWRFWQDLSAKYRGRPKSLTISARGPKLILRHIMVNPALINALRS